MQIKFINRKTGELQVETPPGEGFLKLLYNNPFGKIKLLTNTPLSTIFSTEP